MFSLFRGLSFCLPLLSFNIFVFYFECVSFSQHDLTRMLLLSLVKVVEDEFEEEKRDNKRRKSVVRLTDCTANSLLPASK